MTMTLRRILFLATAAAVFPTCALAAAHTEGSSALSQLPGVAATTETRHLQSSDENVLSVCPDGRQCKNGDRCSKTGKDRNTDIGVLEEYECDCTGSSCKYAPEVYCVVGGSGSADPKTTFCVNEGKCMNDRKGNNDNAKCECTDDFDGPNCQLKKTQSNNPSTEDNNNPNTQSDDVESRGTEGKKLSGGAIFGICFAAFVVTLGGAFLIRRRMDRREVEEPSVLDGEPPSVIDASVGADSGENNRGGGNSQAMI